jgi:hypothetical protein
VDPDEPYEARRGLMRGYPDEALLVELERAVADGWHGEVEPPSHHAHLYLVLLAAELRARTGLSPWESSVTGPQLVLHADRVIRQGVPAGWAAEWISSAELHE